MVETVGNLLSVDAKLVCPCGPPVANPVRGKFDTSRGGIGHLHRFEAGVFALSPKLSEARQPLTEYVDRQ